MRRESADLMRPPLRTARAGFTLVEVMVAVAVSVVMLAMVGTILTSILNTQKKMQTLLLRERVGSAILELISRDVEAAYVYDIQSVVVGVDERGGSGDSDRFEIVTIREPAVKEDPDDPANPANQGAGASAGGGGLFNAGAADTDPIPRDPPRLTKVAYSTRDSRAGSGLLVLFRSERFFLPPPPGSSTGASGSGSGSMTNSAAAAALQGEPAERFMEVYDRVKSFNVRYLYVERQPAAAGQTGGAATQTQGEWKDQWDEPELTPAAIEVALELAPDEGPVDQSRLGQDRPQKIYRTTISIPVTQPVPQQRAGAGASASAGAGS